MPWSRILKICILFGVSSSNFDNMRTFGRPHMASLFRADSGNVMSASYLGCLEGLTLSLLVSKPSLVVSAQFLLQGSASGTCYCKVCGAARGNITLLSPFPV